MINGLKRGIVEKSEIHKGKLRLCADLRDLNKNLLNYNYPIPLMETLKGFTHMSILGLEKSYLKSSIEIRNEEIIYRY